MYFWTLAAPPFLPFLACNLQDFPLFVTPNQKNFEKNSGKCKISLCKLEKKGYNKVE